MATDISNVSDEVIANLSNSLYKEYKRNFDFVADKYCQSKLSGSKIAKIFLIYTHNQGVNLKKYDVSTIEYVFNLATNNKFDEMSFDALSDSKTITSYKQIFICNGVIENIQYEPIKKYKNKQDNSYLLEQGDSNDSYNEFSQVAIPSSTKVANKRGIQGKVFDFIMSKANEQIFSKGALKIKQDNEISFSLNELVQNHTFANLDTARKSIQKMVNVLTSIKVYATCTIKNKQFKTREKHEMSVLFYNIDVINNNVKIAINDKIDWRPILRRIYEVPSIAFSLNKLSYELYIYLQKYIKSKLNSKDLKEKGFISLRVDTIIRWLGLPTLSRTDKPKENILDPIQKAFEEIEKLQFQSNYINFQISEPYLTDPTFKTARDVILNGKIQIIVQKSIFLTCWNKYKN